MNLFNLPCTSRGKRGVGLFAGIVFRGAFIGIRPHIIHMYTDQSLSLALYVRFVNAFVLAAAAA